MRVRVMVRNHGLAATEWELAVSSLSAVAMSTHIRSGPVETVGSDTTHSWDFNVADDSLDELQLALQRRAVIHRVGVTCREIAVAA